MESLNVSLEAEQKSKAEALRIKKKLEGDINELEIGLDQANKANAEGLKALKRYQQQLRDTIQGFEDEARSRQQVCEQVGIAERKANALNGVSILIALSCQRFSDVHIHLELDRTTNLVFSKT